MRKIASQLWAKILIGLGLGVVVGFLLGPDLELISRPTAANAAAWLALPGNLFLDLIRFIVIPLVISSIALGVLGSGSAKRVQKLGLGVMIYFVCTTTIAATIGIAMAYLIEPGSYFEQVSMKKPEEVVQQVSEAAGVGGDIPSTIVDLVPTNPFAAMAEGNLLQVIIAAAIFGLALLVMAPKEAAPLRHLLNSVLSASLTIINFLMRFAPIAVFGLIAKVMIENGVGSLSGLGAYVGTFIAVLVAILVFYSLIVMAFLRYSPLEFAKRIREPFILAFSTSSSSATMPVTLQTAETRLGLKPAVTRLVIPLGTTINLDGTAAYQSVVVVFLAQMFGIDLSLGQVVTLVGMSVAASIGAPGVPGGVLAILVGVLADFGIPAEGFAIVLAVDRILDMSRTSVNVTGDLVTTSVMQKFSGFGFSPPAEEEIPSPRG